MKVKLSFSVLCRGGNRNGEGGWGGGEKIYEFQIQIFKFSDFQIFRFSISDFYFSWKYFRKNMLVRYRGINNKRCPGETRDKMEGFEDHF